jgi:drug/metabolite transporter (DMT)-like permease
VLILFSIANAMATEPAATALDPSLPPKTRPAAAANARPNRLAVALAFAALWLIWGSTYLAIRYAVATIPPLYTAGLRHLIAGSILLAWALAKGLRPTRAQIRASIIIGFFFFLIGHGTLHWAEQQVPSGIAALLIATEPIFMFGVSELAARPRRWRMNSPLAAGSLIGLAGVAVLMKDSILSSTPAMLTGGIAILIGGISWAIGVVYSRRSHLSGQPLLLSALSLLSGAAMLLIIGTLFGEARHFSPAAVAAKSWLALAYLVLFGSVITFTAYNWLLEHYSPTLVATHTYINPVVAVLLGWLIAGERLTPGILLAAAMVVSAVVLVERGTTTLDRSA